MRITSFDSLRSDGVAETKLDHRDDRERDLTIIRIALHQSRQFDSRPVSVPKTSVESTTPR